MKKNRRAGFTLIEVMIVVVILGILAGTVLPQFSASSSDAKQAALTQNLEQFRSQIGLYKFQHGGKTPGFGSTQTIDFKNALLLSSDVKGVTGAPGTLPFGPYFQNRLPVNPYNGGRGIMIVPAPITAATPNESAMDGTDKIGWIYSPSEGQIRGNNVDNGTDGKPLFDL